MKIAFTHNIKLTDSLAEAEFDTPETIDAITNALVASGYVVEKIDVNCPASHLVNRLEAAHPDLIFNTAEGSKGRYREAFYPGLFEQLGIPFTGSDAYTLTLTLDKELSKRVAEGVGVDVPRSFLVTEKNLKSGSLEIGRARFPLIVKPNFEGSSKGIDQNSVVKDLRALQKIINERLPLFPTGLLVEEYIEGRDITVPCIEGLIENPALIPIEYVVDPRYKREFEIYDYALKNTYSDYVGVRCPAQIPRDLTGRVLAQASDLFTAFGCHDMARIDFRLGKDGRLYFLEINALPSLEPGASLYEATKHRFNLNIEQTLESIIHSACRRWGMKEKAIPKKARPAVRVGLAYNLKRSTKLEEAEFDPPKTIDAIEDALESAGHEVIRLEANADFPKVLAETTPDVVFNIAEGYRGRNRESVVPALCELLGIAYTGSDATTLAVALDKSLAKKVMRQHQILTPRGQSFATGKEKLNPEMKFPIILKPNAEGSSKGIEGSTAVVRTEAELRERVAALLVKYGPTILAEEYIPGREFTVGLLGDVRPRVLPPMEIVFLDQSQETPVYDYMIKQDFEKHIRYDCPAKITNEEQKKIERTAREVFSALGCRDVARVDLKMAPTGEVYVIEVNPLPGLTPNYSDLVFISRSANMDYGTLIREILSGGLKRMRIQKRQSRKQIEELNVL